MSSYLGTLRARASARALAEGLDQWRAFMVVLTEELDRYALPEEVEPLFEVARGYWKSEVGTKDDLARAYQECWRHVDQLAADPTSAGNQKRLTRALLCLLSVPADEEEESLTAEFFVDMLGEWAGDDKVRSPD